MKVLKFIPCFLVLVGSLCAQAKNYSVAFKPKVEVYDLSHSNHAKSVFKVTGEVELNDGTKVPILRRAVDILVGDKNGRSYQVCSVIRSSEGISPLPALYPYDSERLKKLFKLTPENEIVLAEGYVFKAKVRAKAAGFFDFLQALPLIGSKISVPKPDIEFEGLYAVPADPCQ